MHQLCCDFSRRLSSTTWGSPTVNNNNNNNNNSFEYNARVGTGKTIDDKI
jgi:hypothetical protein